MIDKYVANDSFTNSNCIPSTFINAVTPYEEVSQLITYVNSLWEQYSVNTTTSNTLQKSYEGLITNLNTLQATIDSFKNGTSIPDGSINLQKLSSNIMNQLNEYITNYMYNSHAFVTFGLEGDYFVVNIPQTWQDINFSTDVEGHLILNF